MTGPQTAPVPVPAGAPAPAGADSEVLARADGVELLGEVPGSGYRRAPALARRGDGQVLTLTPLLHAVLAAVDGRRTVAEVADQVGDATGRLVRPDDVRQLVAASLRPLGLLRLADGSEPEVRRSSPLLALRFRRVVTDPAVTRRLTAPFAALFHPVVVVPVVAAFLAVAGWVFFREGLAAATAQAFRFPGLFLAVVVVTVLSAGFHEFGHAAGARHGGATPGAMGVGLYLFWPAFYTDVTDSYRLGRAGRVRTDLGGLYFNAIVVLLAYGTWLLTGWHAVLLIVATQVLQMVRQLAPLLRFDGYHVLADVTGVPDLYQRIGPVLSGLLPGRWRQPEATALKPWARAVVTAWVLLVVPVMVFSMLSMVLSLPRLLGTAGASVQRQSDELGAAFSDGDLLGVLARALAIVVVVVPVLGIGFVLVRAVRRTATRTWQRTAGRPVRRAVALLVAAALVAGLGWAWWPDGERYRPVRAYEGGTVLDVLPAAQGSTVGLAEGERGAATTLWPADAGPLPTADAPALALVLVPAEKGGTDATGAADGPGAAAPTWVFPFDRPLPPGAGDNQALTVNTTDGSVAYDVSFALVWADGETATNRNEAYAFANCTGCRTVAVAFQVVLLVGSVDVVVPENLSAAVNYGCVDCVTYALATQLVLTVPGELSEQASRDLAAVWAEVQAFGAQLVDVPLAELRARITGFEQRIATIVQQEGAPVGQPAPAGEDAISSPTTSSTTTSSTTSASPTTGSTTGATPTGSPPTRSVPAGATGARSPMGQQSSDGGSADDRTPSAPSTTVPPSPTATPAAPASTASTADETGAGTATGTPAGG